MSTTVIFDAPALAAFRKTNDLLQSLMVGSYTLISSTGDGTLRLLEGNKEVAVFHLSDQHLELIPERSLR